MSGTARRTYDSRLRREQAARTRARIVEAAQRLFVERGFAGTTIPAIAAEAGVAVETVYRATSGKAGLLRDAVRAAVAGGATRADVPVAERPAVRRVIEERDPVQQLRLYARTQPGIWSRVGPLLRVLDAASTSDPALIELREQMDSERRHGLLRLGEDLEQRGALRAGTTAQRAADIVYTVCGKANYESLVTQCGWTEEQYRDWLVETLVAALLPPPGTDHDGPLPPPSG